MKQHDIIKKVNDILEKETNCYFAVVTDEGYPHVSTRSFCRPATILGGYISTNLSGNLAQSVLKNSKASLCVQKDNDNITLMGTAQIVDDMDVKRELWLDWFIDHYPKGVEDAQYCIIEFSTEKVSLWVDREIAKFDVDTFINPVSYCGLLCTTCQFVQSHNCKGCIATEGNPFYGECKIANCAKEKGYAHCGMCPEMPCKALKDFSCGEGEHCDMPKGSRLEILKIWNR